MHCAADIGVRLVSASHNAQSKSIGYACINATNGARRVVTGGTGEHPSLVNPERK